MTLLKEPEFYRKDAKDAKKFKTKLNISYKLACAYEFFPTLLENLGVLGGENDLFFSRVIDKISVNQKNQCASAFTKRSK